MPARLASCVVVGSPLGRVSRYLRLPLQAANADQRFPVSGISSEGVLSQALIRMSRRREGSQSSFSSAPSVANRLLRA
jgi:hypothetical protein